MKKAAAQKITREAKVRRVAAYLALERDADRVESYCAASFGSSPPEARRLIKEARALLALAADVDVREEIGAKKKQLEDLQQRAKEAGDLRVELSAIQELAKLLDLYASATPIDPENGSESVETTLARKHLEGLGVAPIGLPIEELARLVVAAYLELAARGKE